MTMKTILGRIGPKPTQEWKSLHVIWLRRVHFAHDFDSITPLFSKHTPDTGVPKNNRVTLSKSQTERTRLIDQITCNDRHSQAVQNTPDNSRTAHLTSQCEVRRSRTGDT